MASVVKKKKGVKDVANCIAGKPNGCNIINKLKLPPTPVNIKGKREKQNKKKKKVKKLLWE